jgi:CubicO group peptidase (beta-lactamase class C family)
MVNTQYLEILRQGCYMFLRTPRESLPARFSHLEIVAGSVAAFGTRLWLAGSIRLLRGIGLLLLAGLLANASERIDLQNSEVQKRREFLHPENRDWKFQHADQIFPFRTVHAGSNIWHLNKIDQPKRSFQYVWQGKTNDLEHFLEHTGTSAFLVLKDGSVAVEYYTPGSGPATRFMSFSLGKSITSTLVGIALEERLIASLDDPLTKYLPGLTGSAYEKVTIRDALQMLSGIEFDPESNNWNDLSNPQARVFSESVNEHRYRYVEAANTLTRKYPVGSKFVYNSMNTCLLGWLLENVTRQRLARYMEEKLWRPAGMESEAAWLLDGPPEIGREIASGRFVATLRDYGRFGLLMVNGNANGHRVVSAEWIKSATVPSRPPLQFGKLYENYPLGYGYGWWLFENGRYEAVGMFGQFVYIAPKENVVIVKLSRWTEGWVDDLEMETYAFFDAVVEKLK